MFWVPLERLLNGGPTGSSQMSVSSPPACSVPSPPPVRPCGRGLRSRRGRERRARRRFCAYIVGGDLGYDEVIPGYTDQIASLVFSGTPGRAEIDTGGSISEIANAGGLRMDRVASLLLPEEKAVVDVSQDEECFCRHLNTMPPQQRVGRNSHPKVKEQSFKLVLWGVWERLQRCVFLAVTLVWFVVPKGDGGVRLIGDARPLNQAMDPPPRFGLPGLHEVLLMVLRFEWMVELDLKNFFYQIPIHPGIRRFFGARTGAARFVCKVLVMGWSWAPAVACAISRAVIRPFGLAMIVYVDNILVGASTRRCLRSLLRKFRRLCTWLGLIVKSWPRSSRYVTFLGLQLDPRKKRWRLSPEWAAKAAALVRGALGHRGPLPVSTWFRVVGVVVYAASMTTGCAQVWEVLSWASRLGRRIAAGELQWSSDVSPWRRVAAALRRVVRDLEENPWHQVPRIFREVTVFTDASNLGGGWLVHARCPVARAWRFPDPSAHIYAKEMHAALDALRFLLESGVRNALVHLYVDNEAVEGNLRRMYGPHPWVNRALALVGDRLRESEIVLCVHRVPSEDNPADFYSRLAIDDPEHPLLLHEEPAVVMDSRAFQSPCRVRRGDMPHQTV